MVICLHGCDFHLLSFSILNNTNNRFISQQILLMTSESLIYFHWYEWMNTGVGVVALSSLSKLFIYYIYIFNWGEVVINCPCYAVDTQRRIPIGQSSNNTTNSMQKNSCRWTVDTHTHTLAQLHMHEYTYCKRWNGKELLLFNIWLVVVTSFCTYILPQCLFLFVCVTFVPNGRTQTHTTNEWNAEWEKRIERTMKRGEMDVNKHWIASC